MELVVRLGTYYSAGDEASFFSRLNSLRCVQRVQGMHDGLHIHLKRPSDRDLRELIALLFRYDLDMSSLATLKTEKNAGWFGEAKAFWYRKVFGRRR